MHPQDAAHAARIAEAWGDIRLPPSDTPSVYGAMPIRVSISNENGRVLYTFTADYNHFESNKILRKRLIKAMLAKRKVTIEAIDKL